MDNLKKIGRIGIQKFIKKNKGVAVLQFKIENSNWISGSPNSAFFFDELMEFLEDSLPDDLKNIFIENVIKPLDTLYKKKYKDTALTESLNVEREFRFYIPFEIIKSAIPALKWFISKHIEKKDYINTAEEIIKLFQLTENTNNRIYIATI